MRSSIEAKKPSRRHRISLGLAPHVDPVWAEQFAIELRSLGVAGARIGDALREVDSHCQEGDQSAPQAFGDPADYARRLRYRYTPTPPPGPCCVRCHRRCCRSWECSC